MDTTERGFEDIVTERLIAAGWRERDPADYDRARCIDPGALFAFIEATQKPTWERLETIHGPQAREKFLVRLGKEIAARGTLDVLRKGVTDYSCSFTLVYFQPETGLNEAHAANHAQNILGVVRQLHYSRKNENSLDLILFVNGLPVATAELKNHLTGQNLDHAIAQYRTDRDPREPLFAYGRCLVHFAVDEDEVAMTTRLAGPDTRFLPFNRGHDRGKGNPPNPGGYRTAYLWDDVLRTDSFLEILNHFVQEHVERPPHGGTPVRTLIFPRYHQLDAVRRLVADARERGPGRRYLIQHSAGSGKSNTIAWVAHRLAGLHDANDDRVFDTIIVVTDRRVLDRQLRETVGQFEQVDGVVAKIESHSRELREALEAGKNIVVTTLQKFPFIVDDVRNLPGSRFAVVIDEAHSSQSGSSTDTMRQILAAASLDAAAAADAPDVPDPAGEAEEALVRVLAGRGPLPNVSFFAFTATPKDKTLQLFGTELPGGQREAFSLYSMRQAIQEGFILDVLANYTTYRTYFKLAKDIEDDPAYERDRAAVVLRAYASLHEHAIAEKSEIMVEHFWHTVRGRIGGRAKAMIVTRSRLHAVRYKRAIDRYLTERGYPITTLVAFSGEVVDPESGLSYTEPGMNSTPGHHVPETATAATFAGDDFRIMIVAEKFQTGFDQPLLHTMYVDKRLSGVSAVQTLSRLNRIAPDKTETMVLDFENEAEGILASFQPYYETTILSETTDANKLYDLQRILLEFQVFTADDPERFWTILTAQHAKQNQLHPILDAARDRYTYLPKEQRADFAHQLGNFLRLYAFLSQIVPFTDGALEKLYQFGRRLASKLPKDEAMLPIEIAEIVNMDSYKIDKVTDGPIKLERGDGTLDPIAGLGSGQPSQLLLEPLSAIIKEINDRFGTDFSDADRVALAGIRTLIANDDALISRANVAGNSRENLRLVFDDVFLQAMQGLIDANFDLYKRVADEPAFGEAIKSRIFDLVYRELRPSTTVHSPSG